MRLVACAFSAVLLSGCSWLGFGGGSHGQQTNYAHNGAGYGANSSQYDYQTGRKQLGRCQITSPTQPIPQGCRPEQVTLAIGGGQGAQPYAQNQYATGGL